MHWRVRNPFSCWKGVDTICGCTMSGENGGNGISRWTLYRTVLLCLGYAVEGVNSSIIAPTLLHLEFVLHTNTEGMAYTLIGENCGNILGAILCGYLSDKFNAELQYALLFLWTGLCVIIVPWMPNVYLYSIAVTVQSFARGYMHSSFLSHLLTLWKGHKYKEAVMQAMHASWAVGASCVPLIVLPFLLELPVAKSHKRSLSNYTEISAARYSDLGRNIHGQKRHLLGNVRRKIDKSYIKTVDTVKSLEIATMLQYGYLTVGIITVTMSLLFFCAAIKQKRNPQTRVINHDLNQNAEKNASLTGCKSLNKVKPEAKSGRYFEMTLLVLVFCHAKTIVWQGYTLGTFLSVFVIKGLHWPLKKGPLITSLFRGIQGLGRIMGIPISMFLSPTQMLTMNMTLSIVSSIVMIYAPETLDSQVPMWISTIMAGIAISTTFSTAILWGAENLSSVNAGYGSIFTIAASVGRLSASGIMGYLFQIYTPVCVVYFVFSASVLNAGIFFIMYVFRKFHVKKRENAIIAEMVVLINDESSLDKDTKQS